MAARLMTGDCRASMRAMAARGEQVHAVVTDPPYDLKFMGKGWDGTGVAFQPETWRLAWDLLPPGGHLAAFGGTRTFHRMAVAIEDAGFEIRDTLMWLYGTGFPKSHNQKGEWEGWGTALKPAWEPVILARKPLVGTVAQNVLAHGTGAINVDGCRVPSEGGRPREGEASQERRYTERGSTNFAATPGPRGGALEGRWPANVVHDGSDEVEAAFAAFGERPGQQGRASSNPDSPRTRKVYGALGRSDEPMDPRGDSGSASRFFYSAKATKEDRAGSKHPTVKPVALMRWLVRMVTPPGGTVLDPFAGSGTTGAACAAEGFDCVLMEAEPEYQADIRRRLGLAEDPAALAAALL